MVLHPVTRLLRAVKWHMSNTANSMETAIIRLEKMEENYPEPEVAELLQKIELSLASVYTIMEDLDKVIAVPRQISGKSA